jgi:hypothetical protein
MEHPAHIGILQRQTDLDAEKPETDVQQCGRFGRG